jgi:hypothetical protein
MNDQSQSVIGVYDLLPKAEDAIRTLDLAGFPIRRVSIIAQDMQSERQIHGYVTPGDIAKSSAGVAAWIGGLFGVLVGAAFLWVPGFGPLIVAGPLSAALLGGVEGALAGAAGGGVLGALFGMGVSKKHILKYEEQLRGGKYLLLVHGSRTEIARAHEILQGTEPEELNLHVEEAAPAPVATTQA